MTFVKEINGENTGAKIAGGVLIGVAIAVTMFGFMKTYSKSKFMSPIFIYHISSIFWSRILASNGWEVI